MLVFLAKNDSLQFFQKNVLDFDFFLMMHYIRSVHLKCLFENIHQ